MNVLRSFAVATLFILAVRPSEGQEPPAATPSAVLIEKKADPPGNKPDALSATPPPIMGEPTPADTKVETIVFIRHGEKTEPDIGQLSAQGFNRALALPFVLEKKFGRPDYLYAPATTKKLESGGKPYSYVRPLATLEPTAIRLGMTVETKFAFDQIAALQGELSDPVYRESKIFVVWEHHLLSDLVRRFLKAFGGDPTAVGDWAKDDFDGILIVKLYTEPGGRRSVVLQRDKEDLNNLSTTYPEVRLP